ncbi:hypothetical protein ACJIZ3_021200 [Penstemon smallii]|uniref:Bet v I/Major latex protein domain-containing protein n=1 Tax=Penstemon smallii TaxID=265156 RepID=A0ABD3SKR1_9LAMI
MASVSLPNKLITQVAFKADVEIFHHLMANNPQHLTNVTPGKVKGCDLHQGNYGKNGSIVEWKYNIDGKYHTAKCVLQDIDKEKKQIAYKVIEGNLLELYKNVVVTVHVETKGGVDFITWTIDYELLKADNPHPLSHLNYFIEFTKEVEAHYSG